MSMRRKWSWGILAFLLAFSGLSAADEPAFRQVPTVAVLPFETRDRQAEDLRQGSSIAELLGVALLEAGVTEQVERAELDKALAELQLSAQGLTDKESQLKLGKLVGAKILITGSLFRSGSKKFLIAKVIGSETSRVRGCSVSGGGDFSELVPELARKVAALLAASDQLLPKKVSVPGARQKLAETVAGRGRKVYVRVPEEIRADVPDPAAETELKELLLALGFQVVKTPEEADFAIRGEAFAAPAGNYRNFVSAAARVELSIHGRNQALLATGKARETLAGVAYPTAAKEAIGQATLRLAESLLPALK